MLKGFVFVLESRDAATNHLINEMVTSSLSNHFSFVSGLIAGAIVMNLLVMLIIAFSDSIGKTNWYKENSDMIDIMLDFLAEVHDPELTKCVVAACMQVIFDKHGKSPGFPARASAAVL